MNAKAPLTPGAKRAGPGEHVFDMHKVNEIMGGPGYSPVFGPPGAYGTRIFTGLLG